MKAWVLKQICKLSENKRPLELVELPIPLPKDNEVLVKVSACGICRTELDEIEGRTPPPKFPVVLGHQIVGRVERTGRTANNFQHGDKIGIGWIYSSCGKCFFCRDGNENLCENFKATGRDVNGGYAEYMIVSEDFAYKIPEVFSDIETCPLLCAGAVGSRSLRLTELKDKENLGLMGFGASGHILLKVAKNKFPHSKIFVFSRSEAERNFAVELGAFWSGNIEENSPEKLDCIIDTTPAWKPIMASLKNLKGGGRLVINAIRKEELDKEQLLGLDYSLHLWSEKEIKSVANVTRNDIEDFLQTAFQITIKPEIQEFSFEQANEALIELKIGKIRGAKVLKIP